MKTILATAYAMDPYKGSEEGTGWNMVQQIARFNKVIVVTRKNNRGNIEKRIQSDEQVAFRSKNIQFLYFDWPKWAIFWKRGAKISALYYYLWQFSVAFWLRSKKIKFDIAHGINFHSDWTPSFLWILGKPFVWGPVGHHNKIKKEFVLPIYGFKAYFKDRILWLAKNIFWYLDPFLKASVERAEAIFTANNTVSEKLDAQHKSKFLPAVATEIVPYVHREKETFQLLSIGRLVALKGFDITIRSFAYFYNELSTEEQQKVSLTIIGSGPMKEKLEVMIRDHKLEHVIEIIKWMPRKEVLKYYQKSSAFLFPSHEGAGMVVPESMSYGVPVICLNNEGPGAYTPSESQLKVEQTDYENTVEAIGEKIYMLYKDKDLQRRESKSAYMHFKNTFLWNQKGEEFQKVYNQLA